VKRRRHIAWWLSTGCVVANLARAQPQRQYRIGMLIGGSLPPTATANPFDAELARRGFIEGRNLIIDRRAANGDPARLVASAAELVAQQPDVIVTFGGTPAAKAAQAATNRIPIVFDSSRDPIGTGLVASLNRPGGNLTGTALFTRELDTKRMHMLAETLNKPARLAVLDMVRTAERRAALVDPPPALPGVSFELFELPGAAELEAIFQRIVRWRATGLVVMHTPLTSDQAIDIARLAMVHRLPGIADDRRFAESGLMLAYTTDDAERLRRIGEYVSRVLDGARPADLPVVQPSHFEFVVNRKTAVTLGVRIPRALMTQATLVID
jgi:putative tryptophan/tyrosine transport system substrate-binding protein